MLKDRSALMGVLLPFLLPFVSPNELSGIQEQTPPLTGYPPCDALISAGLADNLLLASSENYEPRVHSWFAANAQYRPWCFFQPQSAQGLSLAIKALNRVSFAGDWHIAVRSGGHGPPGSSNIANGVTIDLGLMDGSTYNPNRSFASVEPGGKWKDVYYNLLQHHNVTVTGGRDGGVGVGGFLLGGGNSYYTGRNGFGCDQVVGYQVVLANGTIVEANAEENADLWKALKGGGFNFGIVTRFDIRTMPTVELAYAQQIVSLNRSDRVAEAVVRFTENSKNRTADSLIPLYSYDATDMEGGLVILIQTNSLGDLNTTSFNGVNAIPSLVPSDLKLMSLADAANASQVEPGGLVASSTLTFVNDLELIRQSHAIQIKHIMSLSQKMDPSSFKFQVFYQPIPTNFAEHGLRNGGNMMGLDRVTSDAIMWTAGMSVSPGPEGEAALAIAHAQLAALTAELKELTIEHGKDVELIYMNYADLSQNPLGSYGADNVAFIKKVANQYDPKGFWQQRAPGGFKISRVVD
ncbi:hypothetical protein LTR84_001988 [Exophiala bonariae]|uniref:FAD-binding PCMH-type domain-containing protein n=1 Tax=Exophiala bonariae TaxID=1690606 RepID=A0AAV9NFP2_9EURO|nr:hypothetical protein LTR84_001988 [Exophiala bonariae]